MYRIAQFKGGAGKAFRGHNPRLPVFAVAEDDVIRAIQHDGAAQGEIAGRHIQPGAVPQGFHRRHAFGKGVGGVGAAHRAKSCTRSLTTPGIGQLPGSSCSLHDVLLRVCRVGQRWKFCPAARPVVRFSGNCRAAHDDNYPP